jgi:hypothetical protein
MTRAIRLHCLLAGLLLLPGCLTLDPPSLRTEPIPHNSTLPLVIVVDGAGGFEICARYLGQVVAEDHVPLLVRGYRWTHGYLRIPADQMHHAHLYHEGRKLAELILRWHQERPERPIYLMGHSAGSGIVLVAAEALPAATLERIILLAPAVSYKHDLRPALASSCQGIDVFYSQRDWLCLGLGVLVAGTTDRCWSIGAGKIGFRPVITCAEDETLYAKLHQHPWDASLCWTGNKGGHYGAYQPGFLRAFVLPLLR